jgi:hypothetical protein
MKKSNAYILMYFMLITLVALMTSCATTVHSCEESFKPKIRENYNPRGTSWW